MSTYVFDNSWELERKRLGGLETVLDPGTTRCLAGIGVGPGWTCLEIGGGGGSVTQWLCRRVGRSGKVIATDLDTRFLDALDEPNLQVMHHDVTNDALPESAFDLIHARLVLEHLPSRELVLERLRSALKPGGAVLIEDADFRGYFSSPPAVYMYPVDAQECSVRVWQGAVKAMQAAGYDHAFGARLPEALVRLGFHNVSAEVRIAMHHGATPGSAAPQFTLVHLREGILAAGVTEGDLDREIRRFDDENGYGGIPVVAAWGHRPEEGEVGVTGAMTATDGALEKLRSMPLFAACISDEVRSVCRLGHEVAADPGENLTREGEEGDTFYVIITGTATVRAKRKKLAVLGPGSFFGETALLTQGPRTATVTADTHMRLLALRKDSFDVVLRESPTISRAILEAVAARSANAARLVWP